MISSYQNEKRLTRYPILSAVWIYVVVLGGTFKGFGVIYIGLIDLHRAGEFKTSLVNTVYTAFSCVGCEYDPKIESHSKINRNSTSRSSFFAAKLSVNQR